MFIVCIRCENRILFLEIEEAKKATETAALQSPPPAAGATPDYAAGLAPTPTYAPATPQPVVVSSAGNYIYIKPLLREEHTYFLFKLIALNFMVKYEQKNLKITYSTGNNLLLIINVNCLNILNS